MVVAYAGVCSSVRLGIVHPLDRAGPLSGPGMIRNAPAHPYTLMRPIPCWAPTCCGVRAAREGCVIGSKPAIGGWSARAVDFSSRMWPLSYLTSQALFPTEYITTPNHNSACRPVCVPVHRVRVQARGGPFCLRRESLQRCAFLL